MQCSRRHSVLSNNVSITTKGNKFSSHYEFNKSTNYQGKKVLLLCKKTEVIYPSKLKFLEKVLALLDIGSQSSFVSQKLADRLKLGNIEKARIMEKDLKLFSFGNRIPKQHQTMNVEK